MSDGAHREDPAASPSTVCALTNALLVDAEGRPDGLYTVELTTNGTVGRITNANELTPGGLQTIDLAGDLLVPAAAEPHAHLDKVLTASLVHNPSGDLIGAVNGWNAIVSTLSIADIIRRATAAVHELVAAGVTTVRTHVNVHEGIDLRAMEALLQVRSDVSQLCDVQVVSLTGWVSGPNAANRALLRASVEMDSSVVVGGCPHLDIDAREATDLALDLAGGLGRKLDLHTDENLDPHSEDLRYLAERIVATGFSGGAVASHCCSLGMQDPARQADTSALVAAAGVGVVALPHTNLYLQARGTTTAPPRGLTAVAALRAASVEVAAGADNVRDPFNAMGRHDPCETAALMVIAGHRSPAEAWDMVAGASRALLVGQPRAGQPVPYVRPQTGMVADLVSLRGTDLADALARADQSRRVWKQGRIVAHTTVERRVGSDAS